MNAQLVAWLAEANGGTVALRIDDMDATRYREEYLRDIFDVLEWLGIGWQAGPTDPEDFEERHSLRHRTAYYRAELSAAGERGLELYACRCSRSRLSGPATGGCPGGCRLASHSFVVGETAIRAHVPLGTRIDIDGTAVAIDTVVGDVVVWRRDDLPAYHLASVVEDRDLGVTHVVRGDDLRASTAIQLLLAPYLGAESLADVRFLHHGLMTGADGGKLSKSTLDAGPLPRSAELRERILRAAAELGARVGISEPG